MKKYTFLILIVFLSLSVFNTDNIQAQSQRKLAQTGLKFLSISTDPRVAGMGDAFTSVFGSSTSMLYNPAGMAEQEKVLDISFGLTNWIADINYTHATISFNPFQDYYGIFGVSIVAVDYGDLQGTNYSPDNEKQYIETGNFSPTALSIGLSYARNLSDKFAVGGSVKFVKQSLLNGGLIGLEDTNYEVETFAYDFGLIYKTGLESLNIGMSVRNFSEEIQYIEEGFQLPLTFKIGASINASDVFNLDKSIHSILVTLDTTTPRDYDEQISVGCEYTFLNTFSIRGGYTTPTDEAGLSMGFGVKKELVGVFMSVDYAYTDFGIFGNTHRFAISLAY